MENDNNPRTNSFDDKQLVSETPLGGNCEKKVDAASGNQLKHPQLKRLSHKIAVSVKCQNLLVIQVSKNMICFSCYRGLTHNF